ncbi:MAG: molybdopterin-dependent oxidoreductase [Acidimicrobiales bacterium]|nr:molybdopterin-dependent oxidoreductase [Acidimicrobiales bacterium]
MALPTQTSATTVRTACPLDCPDGCSLDVTVEADRITAIDAVPVGEAANALTDGWICRKVRRMTQRVHGPQRLTTPLARTGPKGAGEFAPISWDDALDRIATAIATAIAEDGPASVVPYLYNSSAAVLASAGLTPLLFEALGTAEVDETICAATASEAWRLVLGSMPSGDPLDVAHSDLVVIWGANPTVSNSHLATLLEQRRRAGARIVVVDPRRTPLAGKAHRHLALLPGTDVVLALALSAELERLGGVDTAFVAAHVEGADEYLAACRAWSVDRAAEVCGIPAADITGLARDIAQAERPLLRVGWGMERNRNGGSAHRAALSLWALAGAFGRPGTGVVGSTSPKESATGGVRDAVLGKGFAGPDRRVVNMNRLGAVLAGEGGPVRVLFVQGSNPAATCPNQESVLDGLARDDLFTVVHDQVLTDTARFADVVLPATTHFEADDLVAGYGNYVVQDAPAVIPPVGESRTNNELAHGLAVRLGLEDDAFDPAPARLRDVLLSGLPLPLRLQAEGFVQFADVWPAHADGGAPTARLVATDAEVAAGADRLPTYRDNDAVGGPLTLLTPATNRTITSMFAEYDPPDPAVRIHPDDAAARGLAAGDAVVVTNGRHEVHVPLAIGSDVRPGVAVMPKGLWCTATPEGWTANVFAPDSLSDLAGGARFNDARVEVRRA